MIEKIKDHMDLAYGHLRELVVSHDNVKKVALAEQEMENAFLALMELEKSMKNGVKEEESDGQTD